MIWDIAVERRLQHGDSRFDLEVAFASDVRRLALFGPSGAGKTKTIEIMAGIVRAERGHVRVAGRTLYDSAAAVDLSPQQRRLGYLFQDYALFPHLTLRQNIGFARRSGWRNPLRRERDAAVERRIESLHLEAVADHYPHQVSGGQRQRCALARALMSDPAALLLDEPFAALDQALRRRLREELAELQHGLAIPVLLITHDEDDLRALADQIVELKGGRVATGPARSEE
ncbi:MAG: ATP-binding cassette domain-containing protein, partial [Burkholderiales bacterium]|nr:ATP-binding cassette domain-containing protein [Burkholderiales bacterium]